MLLTESYAFLKIIICPSGVLRWRQCCLNKETLASWMIEYLRLYLYCWIFLFFWCFPMCPCNSICLSSGVTERPLSAPVVMAISSGSPGHIRLRWPSPHWDGEWRCSFLPFPWCLSPLDSLELEVLPNALTTSLPCLFSSSCCLLDDSLYRMQLGCLASLLSEMCESVEST